MGPMKAAVEFVNELQHGRLLDRLSTVDIHLYGSLSSTGRGHGTDRACLAGLMGFEPHTVDPDLLSELLENTRASGRLHLASSRWIDFDVDSQMIFHEQELPFHPNGMSLVAHAGGSELSRQTYYSVGGGFIVKDGALEEAEPTIEIPNSPYPFSSAEELLALCKQHDLRVSELILENEKVQRSEVEIRRKLATIWQAMDSCIDRGLQQQGQLPGGLNVKRRAQSFHRSLTTTADNLISSSFTAMDWVNLYALAVNEENAAGGRMVTAPTNGAAGIVPAVLRFYMRFSDNPQAKDVCDFLLAAAAIGILCKKNASISGAEVGCQGEVGSACAMAAAGLAEVLGATPEQVENAAEIGLEHNLGLTCDPIGGLVQIPCIERNAIAAAKAINAAQMALRGDGSHYVSLDDVIRTMRDTGKDMMDKYKETSRGGLAVNVIEC